MADSRPMDGMTHSDPNQPFKPEAANFHFRITKRTLAMKRPLYSAAIGLIVCFLSYKRRSEGPLCLVAS